MDFFSFLASAAALAPWFEEFARIGSAFGGEDPSALLPSLRAAGLKAEKAMLAATGGANTHKGLIFSLGTLCASAGILVARGEALSGEACAKGASRILRGTTERDFAACRGKEEARLTVGERLYLRWGATGIRGEAERGFPAVVRGSLPRLRAGLAAGMSLNDALVDDLLLLFTLVEDTNVLGRRGREGLDIVRAEARRALSLGGVATEAGMAAIRAADTLFTAENISPGGCADLLAVTYFLWALSERLRPATG